MKKTINMETYGKLEHFEYYRDMEYPYVSISVPVDISELISLAKARKDSLFIYLLYLSLIHIFGRRGRSKF